jgi:hypothetical protein
VADFGAKALLLLAFAAPAFSQGDADGKIAYKFTPDFYSTTNEHSAYDLNLRAALGPHDAWIGYYRRGSEFDQLRLGYEGSFEMPFGRLVPSVQVATHGFAGGSLNAQVGGKVFGLLGIGRTNLKPYFNLNFDPNDAVTFGAGTHALPNTTLTLYQVRDDRLDTGQRVTHLTARIISDGGMRWTVDLFHKQGSETAGGEQVHGTGVAVTVDLDRYFVRLANDPYVNFSPDRMVRAAVGVRF